jgi:hypothetical protein
LRPAPAIRFDLRATQSKEKQIMTLGDYVDTRWKVIQADGSSCQKDDDVRFIGKLGSPGTPDMVMIRCTRKDETIASFDGQYDQDTHGINGVTNDGEYEIRMVEVEPDQKPRIKFTQQGGPRAGSWTAEDNGSWPVDG